MNKSTKNGGRIEIRGVGSFSVRDYRAYSDFPVAVKR